MSAHSIKPELWSDFDGTAVAIKGKTNWRNWSKYPLPGIPGYINFLKGVALSDVRVAGVVSRRPNIFLRRMATVRSIDQLGYDAFFARPEQILHMGSEEAKGRFLVERSRETAVGMLEDRPHRLGAVMLGAFTTALQQPETPHHPVLLGVVAHGRSQEYIEKLAAVAQTQVHDEVRLTDGGFQVEAASFKLHVVPLEPYSEAAGAAFGNQLQALAT